MRTRLLDRDKPSVLRVTVAKVRAIAGDSHSLTLQTTATVQGKRNLSSANSDMINQQALTRVGAEITGRIRIDILADDVIRVRYAEGEATPENATKMVVGAFDCPAALRWTCDGQPLDPGKGAIPDTAATIEATTAKLRLSIRLSPYRLELFDASGTPITAIGGPELNNFCAWDSYNTGVCRSLIDGDAPIATEKFDLAYDECIYGLGEKFIKLNKVGQTIDLDMVDALGVSTPRSYKNVPFYVSSKGYGVFFNHSSLMSYWVGSASAMDVQVAAEDDFLDYYLFTGSIRQVLSNYTRLTGKAAMPPKWTFGFWQSKISYSSAAEVLEIAQTYRRSGIPCDVIHLDTNWFKADWYCDLEFHKENFPNPAEFFAQMKALGIKISLWQLPYIPSGSALFAELEAVGGFVKNKEGGVYDVKLCFTKGFQGIVGIVDYTNPEAVRVHQAHFRRLFRLGAKVIKTDFGELAPLDGIYHDGTPGHRMHNLYPLLYNEAIFDVTKEETGEGVVWGRSAWAGSQRYPIHWGGDNSPNYANLAPQMEGGLSFGLSGFAFWSQDIGGFNGATADELLIRWMQAGMFTSHSRIHGFGNRELYKFAPETQRICADFIRLRYRLLPYVYGQAAQCVQESVPMLRAMVIDYQDDPNVANLGDQWLFGDSLLVAPIYNERGVRRVYLPAGAWTDWWTNQRIAGCRWIEARAPLDRMPLYVKEGGIIAMGPVMNYVDEKRIDQIELLVARFDGDGQSRAQVSVNDEMVEVRYTRRGGVDSLHIGPSKARFVVRAMDGQPIAAESGASADGG